MAENQNTSEVQDLDLAGLFRRLAPAFPELDLPHEGSLTSLESELERGRRSVRTDIYMAASTGAVALIASLPVLLVRGFRFAKSIEPTVERQLSQRSYLGSHPEVALAAGMAAAAAIIYTLAMPLFHPAKRDIGSLGGWPSVIHRIAQRYAIARAAARHIRRSRMRFEIDQGSRRFVFYTVIADYLALGVGLLFLCSYQVGGAGWTAWAVLTWMCVPLLFLSLVPTLTVVFVSGLFVKRGKLVDTAPQAALLRQLLLLLDNLKDIATPSDLSSERRRVLMGRMGYVAQLLRGLYNSARNPNAPTLLAARRIAEAADQFLALSSLVAFPKEGSLLELKRNIVTYANVVAGGTFDALPRRAGGESPGLDRQLTRTAKWSRIGGLLRLFLLLSIPPAGYLGLVSHFHVNLPTPFSPAIVLLYSGWAVLCLVDHIDSLAPEAKATLIDVIKLVFRR